MKKNNPTHLSIGPSFKFRWYLFLKLPAAFFSGVRITEISNEKCVTSVPFKWLTQNPFRSTYFASLAMAAEMSTGVLALQRLYSKNPPVSMLVTKMEARYIKKARERVFFSCEEGLSIAEAIENASRSAEAITLTVTSNGRNHSGELIAEFSFTWSFKVKHPKAT